VPVVLRGLPGYYNELHNPGEEVHSPGNELHNMVLDTLHRLAFSQLYLP